MLPTVHMRPLYGQSQQMSWAGPRQFGNWPGVIRRVRVLGGDESIRTGNVCRNLISD